MPAMEPRPVSKPASAPPDWWWIFDPRVSLRARAALTVGVTALLLTALFGTIAHHLLRADLERHLGSGFETLAYQMSDKLDRVIYQRYHEMQLAATLGPFRTSDASEAERRMLLQAMLESAPDFAWIGFADPTGRVRVATGKVWENTMVDARPWFRVGRQRPYAGPLTEIPTLTRELQGSERSDPPKYLDLSIPVQGGNGEFLGVIGAYLQWEWAREVQHSVVAEALRRDRIGLTLYGPNGDVLLDSGGSGWNHPPDAPSVEARNPRGRFVESTTVGTTYLTGYSRSRGYREFRGLGWLTTVRQPAERALAPARELQHRIVGWGLAFTALLGVVSWIAAGRLARRLRGIGAAADRVRDGDVLTVMPRPPGESEVARMCRALGEMVEDFRKKQDALETEKRRREAREAESINRQ